MNFQKINKNYKLICHNKFKRGFKWIIVKVLMQKLDAKTHLRQKELMKKLLIFIHFLILIQIIKIINRNQIKN